MIDIKCARSSRSVPRDRRLRCGSWIEVFVAGCRKPSGLFPPVHTSRAAESDFESHPRYVGRDSHRPRRVPRLGTLILGRRHLVRTLPIYTRALRTCRLLRFLRGWSVKLDAVRPVTGGYEIGYATAVTRGGRLCGFRPSERPYSRELVVSHGLS
jgi:hypothetical protein